MRDSLKLELVNVISRRACGLVEDGGAKETIQTCAEAIRLLTANSADKEDLLDNPHDVYGIICDAFIYVQLNTSDKYYQSDAHDAEEKKAYYEAYKRKMRELEKAHMAFKNRLEI